MKDDRRTVLLLTPPYHAGVVESAGRWMPLGCVYLAGAARQAGWQAEICDAMTLQYGLEEIREVVEATAPDMIAMTAITASIPAALEVLHDIRRRHPDIMNVLGGIHPTFCAEEILQQHAGGVDIVVRGEGEMTFRALLEEISRGGTLHAVEGLSFHENGRVVHTVSREFISDLDSLPAAWDLVRWEDYRYYVLPGSRLAAVSTSRGCTHECTFCSQQKFWQRTWRARSPSAVVDEILMLHDRFGADVLLLVDEHPTHDRERWEEILDRLIRAQRPLHLLMETRVGDIVRDADLMERYRKAGVIHIYVGVEATSQETLDRIRKDISVEESREAIRLIHSVGMITETSFVLGFPWENKETIAATVELALHYAPDFAHFLAITPWPYADIYCELAPFIAVEDFSRYNLVDPIVRPESMTLDEIRRAIVDCYRRYYMKRIPYYMSIRDSFKREYIKTSMKLIMTNSFLTGLLRETGVSIDLPFTHHSNSQD
ncbi:MAG: cobalamin-dependent protein [Bacteroidetes bacterium]|nr:cobalamin-dependent protein [Bacteroidota bacterium]